VSVNELIRLYTPWFNTLIPQSHASRMGAHEWSCVGHAWLYSGYTTLDSMLEIGTTSETVE